MEEPGGGNTAANKGDSPGEPKKWLINKVIIKIKFRLLRIQFLKWETCVQKVSFKNIEKREENWQIFSG